LGVDVIIVWFPDAGNCADNFLPSVFELECLGSLLAGRIVSGVLDFLSESVEG
jgi:hypothetical protein